MTKLLTKKETKMDKETMAKKIKKFIKNEAVFENNRLGQSFIIYDYYLDKFCEKLSEKLKEADDET